MTSLFISYSRRDIDFARRLTDSFKDRELEFWIDWEGIPPTVDWWKEIEKGIEEADVFLFLISPDSAKSRVCQREIEHAVRNGKRMIPLVVRDIKGDEAPVELAHLNWIFIREDDDFQPAFDKLITAIQTDFAWVKAHRQLQVKALEWDRNNMENSLLLRGKELADAEFQLATNTSKEPHPTDLQREYVFQSRQAVDKQRRRNSSITVIVGVVMAVLAVVALIQAGLARGAQTVAEEQRDIAIARQLAAQAETIRLTGSARQQTLAFLLATQSMKMFPSDQASEILRDNSLGHPIAQVNRGGTQTVPAVSLDGQYVATAGCYKTEENENCSETAVFIWETLTGKEIARLPHTTQILSIAFSPDGRYVISGGDDGLARVWDITTGQENSRMVHDDGIETIAISHDGSFVASAGYDGVILVWDAVDGQEIARFTSESEVYQLAISPDDKYVVSTHGSVVRVWQAATGREVVSVDHEDGVFSIAISPDGHYVLSGDSSEARVWEILTGQEIARFRQGGTISSAAFSPDGRFVVLGNSFFPTFINIGYSARVWEVSTETEIARMTHDSEVNFVAFSNDGRYVVSGSADGTARVWDASTGVEVSRMIHEGLVIFAAFTPDGTHVVSTGSDGNTIVWEVVTDQPIIIQNHEVGVNSLAISPDGGKIASGSGGCGATEDFTFFCLGAVKVWEASTGNEILHVDYEEFTITSVAFAPDGNHVAAGSEDKAVILLDLATGNEIARLAHDNVVLSVDVSTDGRYVLSGGRDKTARVWEMDARQEVFQLIHEGSVIHVAFLPGGRHILTASDDGTARVWDVLTGEELARTTHDGVVTSIAASMDGQYIASADDPSIRVWEAVTAREIARLNQGDVVNAVAFSPEGKYIASGGADNTARVWDLEARQELGRMTFDEDVTAVAFSSDGGYVIASSWDRTVRVWELASGREVARMIHDDVVHVAAFGPDDRYAISGGGSNLYWDLTDGTVRMWLWRADDLIAHACSHLPRNLTYSEWRQYLGDKPYEAVCPNLPVEIVPDGTEIP